MTQLLRLRLNWTGFSGGPGYTNLHFGVPGGSDGAWITPENIASAVSKTDTFVNVLNAALPSAVSLQIDKTAEVIAIVDGRLIDYKTVSPFARANGSGTGNWSAASGAVINWYSSGIRNGRRVRGRTFVVPLAGSALDSNGTIADATVSAFANAATALLAPGTGGIQLHVWGRPTRSDVIDPATGKKTVNADGVAHPAISARVPDKVAVLTSRRD